MRALIVDDEPIARRVLREELEGIEGVEVVSEAGCGEEALACIAAARPDLVFLDLQMPGLGGFDVVSRLEGGRLPAIVIVTAYDRFAIEAFEAGAVDYLLKPVSRPRLERALERARQLCGYGEEVAKSLLRIQDMAAARRTLPAAFKKIIGRIGQEYFLLNSEEIVAFEADGDLVWVVTGKRKYLATETLRTLEQRLEDGPFRRVHRNALVNLAHVRKMGALTSRRWLLTMDNGQEFVVSKRQAGLVREILGS
jgi:DNA-binding LytR/AlgR family response regulator